MPCLVSEDKMREIAAEVEAIVKKHFAEIHADVYGTEDMPSPRGPIVRPDGTASYVPGGRLPGYVEPVPETASAREAWVRLQGFVTGMFTMLGITVAYLLVSLFLKGAL